MTPAEKESELIEELSIFPDAFECMTHLVECDKRRPGLPEHLKTDDRLVPGCQSRVWIVSEIADGRVTFTSDSDAPIVRALAATLCRIFSHSTPEDVSAHEPDFLDRLQLRAQLTPTRQNGFERMIEQIKRGDAS